MPLEDVAAEPSPRQQSRSRSGSLWARAQTANQRQHPHPHAHAPPAEEAPPQSFVWYHPPTAMCQWGEPQPDPHTDWFDLFFDLIFVATCYQLGSLLASSVNWTGLAYFSALFLTMLKSWENKLSYDARINTDDVAHKVLDVLEAMLVAGSALHISGFKTNSPLQDMRDLTTSHAFGFSELTVALRLLHLLRWVEVYYSSNKVTDSAKAKLAKMNMGNMAGAVIFAAATVFSNSEWTRCESSDIACALWFAAALFERYLTLGLFILFPMPKENRIPMHIGYTIHRYGELTMLVLGESILSLIVGTKLDATPSFYVLFCACFIVTMSLKFIHYSTQPFVPDAHAMRNKDLNAIAWERVNTFYLLALVTFGASVKFLLKYHSHAGNCGNVSNRLLASSYYSTPYSAYAAESTEDPTCFEDEYAQLFCFSLGIVFILVQLMAMLHKGQEAPPFREMLHDWRRHLIGGGHHWGPSFGTFKVIIATSFFILPSFNLSPLGLAITSAAISVSAAALETSGSGEEEAVHSSGTLNGQGIGDTLDKEEAKRDMPSPRKSRAATVMRPENEATEPNSEEPFRPPVFRFYLPPIQMVHWGDPQLRPHTDWFDLFFDLIFVAIALQLGTFLSYSVNRIGALYFVSMVLTILGSWATKHNYEARIDTEDLFHKLVDVLEALLVAGQGLHIAGSNNLSPLEDMQDLNTGFALGFSTLTFLLRLIHALLWLEVYWYGEEVPDEARSGFGATIFDKALPVIVHAAAVFFSCPSLFGDVINANVACALWFFASMIEQFGGIFFLVIVVPHWPKEKRIPIHVAYSAHRHGELTMLLMGEAILSLIVGVSLKPLPSFYLVFAFGFIAAMSLKFVHYSTQPIQANAHALRQNVSQAIIWVRGQYLHSMALIAFGVSLKILLKYHDYEGCSDESDVDSSNSGGSSYSSSYSSSHRLLDSASFYGASSYSAYSAYDSGASGSKCLKHDYTVLFSVSLGCSYVLDLITGAQHKGQAIFPPISEWRSHFTGPRGISFASPRVCVAFAIFLLPLFQLSCVGLSGTAAALMAFAAVVEIAARPPEFNHHDDHQDHGIELSSGHSTTTDDHPTLTRRPSTAARPHPLMVIDSKLNVEEAPPEVYLLYLAPTQMSQWGQPKLHPHTDWGDLFFDLPFVATAYQLGSLLTYSMTWAGLAYFVVLFLTMHKCWSNKTLYDARISNDDLLHKLVEVLEAVLVTTAALHISGAKSDSPLEDMRDLTTSHAFGFSLLIALVRILDVCRYVEFIYKGEESTPEVKKHLLGRTGFDKIVASLLFVVASLCSNPTIMGNVSSDRAFTLWLTAAVVEFFWQPASLLWFPVSQAGRIPLHVAYTIHRNGAFTMLMLGESILSLVLGVALDAVPSFYFIFVFAFLTALGLQFISYVLQPFNPDLHAMRVSPAAGVAWHKFQVLYVISLVAFGVSLKLLLKYHDHEGCSDDESDPRSGSYAYASSYSSYSGTSYSSASVYSADSAYSSGVSERKCLQPEYAQLYCGSLGASYLLVKLMSVQHKGQGVPRLRVVLGDWRRHLFGGARRCGPSAATWKVLTLVAIFGLPSFHLGPVALAALGAALVAFAAALEVSTHMAHRDESGHGDEGHQRGSRGQAASRLRSTSQFDAANPLGLLPIPEKPTAASRSTSAPLWFQSEISRTI